MRQESFNAGALKLIRCLRQLNEAQLAKKVQVSRQYLHAVESREEVPTASFVKELALVLGVLPSFFTATDVPYIPADSRFCFRKRPRTTKVTEYTIKAFSACINWLVCCLEEDLQLPELNIPSISSQCVSNFDDIECYAEECRKNWGIGLGPISDMHRLAERIGVVVTHLPFKAQSIDAALLIAERPNIALNSDHMSCCRQRFNIAHELGHLMFQNNTLNERDSEECAHRFASALLIPRKMMQQYFPRPWPFFNWSALSEFKQQWKVSKAAILYRAFQLDLISQIEYKTGYIKLYKGGEAKVEIEDPAMILEEPKLLQRTLRVLRDRKNITGQMFALNKLHMLPCSWKLLGLESLSHSLNQAARFVSAS